MSRPKLREISEASLRDPKQAILDHLPDISQVEIFHNQVMVATYITPPKVFKGPNGEDVPFQLPDKTLAEDRFQGKVGLVLKIGPLAFRDAGPHIQFGGVSVKVHDWVFFRPADGMEFFSKDRTGGVPCRVFEDTAIKGRVSDPAMLW